MRKLLVILLGALLVAPVEYASAQNLSKAIKKEYKSKMKQLKKEKWELYGSSRTLEVTLARYYEELDSKENVREIMPLSSLGWSRLPTPCRWCSR